MVYYVPVKVTIDAPGLAEVIINVVVHHHGVPESIMTDQGLLFISKFWFLLCYFLGIKKKLSPALHIQTDGQIERQNSIIEDNTRKRRVDKALPEPEKELEFESGGNKEYEVEAIIDSVVYG